eukprot:5899790-Amphidinium_carterae.1
MTSFGASTACDLWTCILELLLILDPGSGLGRRGAVASSFSCGRMVLGSVRPLGLGLRLMEWVLYVQHSGSVIVCLLLVPCLTLALARLA